MPESATTLWRPEFLVLFGIALIQNMDRTVMGALLQPIKKAFALTDATTGVLAGAAFGLAYVFLCLPFARLADAINRRKILAIAVGFWSLCTLSCGYALGFWTFFVCRLGVGMFEAAGTPAMNALCADRLSTRRSSAASLLMVGAVLGAMIGITAGGAIGARYGWRMAFWLEGLPGLLLTPLALRFLIEPRPSRVSVRPSDILGGAAWQAYRGLLNKQAFRNLLFASVAYALWYWGSATWFITFLVRSHGMSLAEAALGYGVLSGISTLAGVIVNGALGDRLAKRDVRWLGFLPAVAVLLCTACAVPVYLVSSGVLALGLYLFASAFSGVVIPAEYALTYALSGVRARAIGIALLLLATQITGLTVAAAAVGALSDALTGRYGAESLRMSLLATTAVLPVAALFFYNCTRSFDHDIGPEL